MENHDLEIASASAQQPTVSQPESDATTAMIVDVQESNVQTNAPTIDTAASPAAPSTAADAIDQAIAEGKPAENYDSSDLESSDDDDSDSDSDDAEAAGTHIENDAIYSDEEGYDNGPVRTKNEVSEVEVAKPNFSIEDNTELRLVGTILEVIDKVIIVQSDPSMTVALDMGTLFTYADRKIMGEVFETFGPVSKPFYSVLHNSAEEIDKERAVVGAMVYYVPGYSGTQVVPTEELKRQKGTDASNVFDEEISEAEQEFSDDEQEQLHKRLQRQKNVAKKVQPNGEQPDRPAAPKKQKRRGPPQKKQKFYDEPADDFDSALAAYERSQPIRQIQSYADISTAPSRQMQDYADIIDNSVRPPAQQQQQTVTASAPVTQASPSYKTPEELVAALFGSQPKPPSAATPSQSTGTPAAEAPAPAPGSARDVLLQMLNQQKQSQ